MNGLCNLKNVYQAIIFPKENVKDKKTYIGISSVRWKLRYNNHIHSFSLKRLRNQRSTTPSCFDGRCNLCLEEKIQIMLYFDPVNLLNQRCDLKVRGRHKMNLDYFQKLVNK